MSEHAGKREWPFRVLKTVSDEPRSTELPTQGALVPQKSTGMPHATTKAVGTPVKSPATAIGVSRVISR